MSGRDKDEREEEEIAEYIISSRRPKTFHPNTKLGKISKDVTLLSLIVIVLQSSCFVFVRLCIVLRCCSLLSLLSDEQIREPLLAATGRHGKTFNLEARNNSCRM